MAVETPNDPAQLQNDFRTNCHSGQPSGRLSFNTDKCKVLTVKLGNRTQFSIQYKINSKKTLEALESHPYLGVELTTSLNWNKHAEKVIVKANRSLGFFKRKLSESPSIMIQHSGPSTFGVRQFCMVATSKVPDQ